MTRSHPGAAVAGRIGASAGQPIATEAGPVGLTPGRAIPAGIISAGITPAATIPAATIRSGRRAALSLGLGGLLAGCGFHPVYMPTGNDPAPAAGLAEIDVKPIYDRPGQILRQALLARLGIEPGTPRKFDLEVKFWIAGEAQGILNFTQPTRIRLVGYTTWTLLSRDHKPIKLAEGADSLVDGVDFFDFSISPWTWRPRRCSAGWPRRWPNRSHSGSPCGSTNTQRRSDEACTSAGRGLPARSGPLSGRAAVWRRRRHDPRPGDCFGPYRRGRPG